ncbi:MAG: oligosaccharide flippase family protein [Candidatus Hydrogenedentales bacterium]|jgi:O-antigen/teichoic acid export membrane protein
MSYSRQYFYHTVTSVGAAIACGALFYLMRMVLNARLTPEEFGLFYAAFSFFSILQPFFSFGFDPGLTPYVTQLRESKDYASMKALLVGSLVPQGIVASILAAIIWVFARPIADWALENGAGVFTLRVLAIHACIVILFKVGQQTLLGLQFVAWRNAADVVRSVVCVGATLLFLEWGGGLASVAPAYVLGAVAATALQLLAIFVSYKGLLRAPLSWRPDLLRDSFVHGKYLSIAFGGVVLFSNVDTLILTLVTRDLRSVGAYQIAVPTVTILYTLMMAGAAPFLPMVRTLWLRKQNDLLADGLSRMYEAAAVLMLPTGIFLACFSDVFITTLFRNGVLQAPLAFNILAIGSFLFFVTYLNLHVLAGIEAASDACRAIAVSLVINAALAIPLIWGLGIAGAALSTVMAHGLAASWTTRAIRTRLAARIPLRAICASGGLAALLAVACLALRHTDAFAHQPLLVSAAACVIAMASCVSLLEVIGVCNLRSLVRLSANKG